MYYILAVQTHIVQGPTVIENHLWKHENTDSDSLLLGWDPIACISNKFPGDSNVSGPQTTLLLGKI